MKIPLSSQGAQSRFPKVLIFVELLESEILTIIFDGKEEDKQNILLPLIGWKLVVYAKGKEESSYK
jgi:hypothetical protein